MGIVFTALDPAPFCIDDEAATFQQFVGHLYGSLQVATTILLQVEDEGLHAF